MQLMVHSLEVSQRSSPALSPVQTAGARPPTPATGRAAWGFKTEKYIPSVLPEAKLTYELGKPEIPCHGKVWQGHVANI